MLGCKLFNPYSVYMPLQRINRYMLGCKYHTYKTSSSDKKELIDTCWDVNTIAKMNIIDVFRINRYMLGCKWRISLFGLICVAELIDTCWDVNSLILRQAIHPD